MINIFFSRAGRTQGLLYKHRRCCAGKFVHGYGSVRNFPTMHPVMYEEIACCVFEQDYDLILVSFRGPSGIRLGKVSVVDSGGARRAELEGLEDGARYRGRRD